MSINKYYQEIIELILDLHHNELKSAKPGHCMKISGLAFKELNALSEKIGSQFPQIDTYIISEINHNEKCISATKLIELRNSQAKPLLILIPSNSRTAAEDSYGNATFKELSLEGVETKLIDKLIDEIPPQFKNLIIEDIIKFIGFGNLSNSDIINFLIDLKEHGYTQQSIGDFIYNLNLIPDSKLLEDTNKIRSRIKFNSDCIGILSTFDKPVADRISDIPIESNTLQSEIVNFIKKEEYLSTKKEIAEAIFENYACLNFSQWKISELEVDHNDIKLTIDKIKSSDFQVENDKKTLYANPNSPSKIKVRFSTKPNPSQISDLKYFRIVLMAVDGGRGEEITVLRKLKNSSSSRAYRDAEVELHPNIIDDGAYFIKVLAENEFGDLLNTNDDFKDLKIQKAWEEERNENPEASKLDFPYKLTCDSEDFDFVVDDTIEREDNQRKDKLKSVLQAYINHRIYDIKQDNEPSIPEPKEPSNTWLDDNKMGHTSHFHINYSKNHNYQIHLSTKLRSIENKILENSDSLGFVKVRLNHNAAYTNLSDCKFIESELTLNAPEPVLRLRTKIFKRIKNSNEDKNGVFETADIFNFKDDIEEYISAYTSWTTELKRQISSNEISEDDRANLVELVSELQFLDVIKLDTKLPDGKKIEAILLSPLHPLRLTWAIQLLDVFSKWENETLGFNKYKESWANNLESLFNNDFSYANNPLVIVGKKALKHYYYSGELSFGWGLYLEGSESIDNKALTSVSRQLLHYFRTLFNVTKENYVDTDISKKLVIAHIKDYLRQHPYVDKLILNLINAGDANVFSDALIELEKEAEYCAIKYEIRLFKDTNKIIEHGEALKSLLNPDSSISEEAEAFSQPSKNRLFPKLRFSINEISDYLKNPLKYNAHISFLISPFPIKIELVKPYGDTRNFFVNGILTEYSVRVENEENKFRWNRFIRANDLPIEYANSGKMGIELFENIQSFTSCALKLEYTQAIPSTQMVLNERDKVLITHLHDYSDWVVTFDKNMGPEVYDQPSNGEDIPFLLDYVPGEEISGISSYLTTRPTSEVLGLIGPHFKEFGLNIHDEDHKIKIKSLLEDLRALSSSLVLQLNSSKNKAFEVIGSAFTKRVLEKKGFLENGVLIPIDLHQNLFNDKKFESKSRADSLLIALDPENKEIIITVIEIKCRKHLNDTEREDLKLKIKEQIENTIEVLRYHFDPQYNLSYDRLDREIKTKELRNLLGFYINRANRYTYLSDLVYDNYNEFLLKLDYGYSLKFKKVGIIYDFSTNKKHHKELFDGDITMFTMGHDLIEDILDPDSDLNTIRLETDDLDNDLKEALGIDNRMKKFLQKLNKKAGPTEVENQNDEMPNSATEEKGETNLNETSTIKSEIVRDEVEKTNFETELSEVSKPISVKPYSEPEFDLFVGNSKPSSQFGLLGETSHQNKKIAIDLSGVNTISLFGVQGGGKSYSIGTLTEMVLKQFSNVNKLPSPLAGVIFHYSESMDYEPEFTSMTQGNDQPNELKILKEVYNVDPDSIDDIIILCPERKVDERKNQFPSVEVAPLLFNPNELSIKDWQFLMNAVGNTSDYINEINFILEELFDSNNLNVSTLNQAISESELLSKRDKTLATRRIRFASKYVKDVNYLSNYLNPSKLIIIDMRDEFIHKDQALGLFVTALDIFSATNSSENQFNKFIVFDEAHKYMDNKDLTGNIVTAIREMRHKGVSILIASQDPPSLPNEIIELSSVVILHKFNSPQWLKHIQKSITQLSSLTPSDMSVLKPGEGFLWASKATEKRVTNQPIKISTRPRVTKHGGSTINAVKKDE
ncbi:ATP-binding protein [Gramella jeungdoensis]|uniref:ATP-binding protein n=1 Tax=Gramella jeungdoensis TaxID=708091 RepID=A0ABT0Z0U3_9FLAO|nr:ATP-binding protein [Gramella jeungdoensis]MCM8568890.1 ATP-binding protein [Gramella jeungdoensis]